MIKSASATTFHLDDIALKKFLMTRSILKWRERLQALVRLFNLHELPLDAVTEALDLLIPLLMEARLGLSRATKIDGAGLA
jgi:hypothetical protein